MLQQHLTRKIVNTDPSYLSFWSAEAVDLIDQVVHDRLGVEGPEKSWVPARSDVSVQECIDQANRLPQLIEVGVSCVCCSDAVV